MIIIYIRRKTLEKHDACAEGLALYDRISALQGRPDRIRTRWTALHDMWLSTAYPAFAGWLRDREMIPRMSFVDADLSGADLRGADLYGANLDGANLDGADLYGADIDGANLRGADLRGANLVDANLYGADLRSANLVGASLDGASLAGANLDGAYRSAADLAIAGWELDTNGQLRRKTT